MAAKRKHDPKRLRDAGEPKPSAGGLDIGDAGGRETPAGSPARKLQEDLETRLSASGRKARIIKLGRFLASVSGITLILGVFLISGIW